MIEGFGRLSSAKSIGRRGLLAFFDRRAILFKIGSRPIEIGGGQVDGNRGFGSSVDSVTSKGTCVAKEIEKTLAARLAANH